MQFDGLDLPPEATDEWIKNTNAREDVIITVPLSITNGNTPWVVGASIFGESTVSMVYNNFGSWGLFTEYTLQNDINIYSDDLLSPSVSLQGKDAKVMSKVALKFGEKLKEVYQVGFVPYIRTDMGDVIKDGRENCDCNSISESQVQVMPGICEIEGIRIYTCRECMKAHGLEYDRRPIRNEKAFDADWILDGETPDGFEEIGDDNAYLLYSSGTPSQKLEHAIGLMNMIGGGISESFSTYYPGNEDALVYVQGESLVGYLTWAPEADGRQSLQQLYIRPGYRRQGIASTLIEVWADSYCEDEAFYVEEPNEESRRLFNKLGYWTGEKEPKAIEHYLLRGVENNLEAGMKTGESMSRIQSQL
ncbi:GNAT family N-acetyltransferase [Natrialbaceae archaeon A-CW1-1]